MKDKKCPLDRNITMLLATSLVLVAVFTLVMNFGYWKNNVSPEIQEQILLFRIHAHLI
jgi:hypothetical protein